MNPDSPVGRILSLDEASVFFERCMQAEKVMGPLSLEERRVILDNFGKELTLEDLTEMVKQKRALVLKGTNE